MSVVGKSVADTTPVEVYQPVGLVSGAGGLGTEDNPIYTADGGGGAIGSVDDAAWTGTGSGTVIAILKGMYLQQAQIATDTNEVVQDTAVMIATLNTIATNTTPNG